MIDLRISSSIMKFVIILGYEVVWNIKYSKISYFFLVWWVVFR